MGNKQLKEKSQKIVKKSETSSDDNNNKITMQYDNFMKSCANGNLSEIKHHLSNGIDPNKKDEFGQNAAHICYKNGQLEAAKMIMSQIKDIFDTDGDGNMLLHIAERHHYLHLRNLFSSYADEFPNEPLHRWFRNVKNKFGNTPLHESILGGAAKANLVRDVGSGWHDATQFNNLGQSPLHLAVENNNASQVEAFIECGISPDQRTENGAPPLWLTVMKDLPDMMRFLVHEMGADVNARHYGTNATPLWLAVLKKNEVYVKFLLENNADIEAVASDGTSPLTLSAAIPELRNIFNTLIKYLPSEKIAILCIEFGLADLIDEYITPKRLEQELLKGNNLLVLAIQSDHAETVQKVLSICESSKKFRHLHNEAINTMALERGFKDVIHVVFKHIGTDYNECKECMVLERPSYLSEISKIAPSFSEEDEDMEEFLRPFNQDWFKIHVDEDDMISLDNFKEFLLPTFKISDKNFYEQRQGDPLCTPSFKECYSDHVKQSNDDEAEIVAKIVKFCIDLEDAIKDNPTMKSLDVSFNPVGSLIEGSRIGLPNEMDLNVFFRALHGALKFGDTFDTLIVKEEFVGKFSQNIFKDSDDDNETKKLDISWLFFEFMKSMERAVSNIELPDGVSKRNTTCDNCFNETRAIFPVHKQCKHQTPAVTFTKVGACINLQVSIGKRYQNMIFNIDFVPLFIADLDEISVFDVHAKVQSFLITEKPPEWLNYLRKYLLSDRMFIGHFDLQKDSDTFSLGIKFLNVNGDLVLRPGFKMNAKSLLKGTILQTYKNMKLLKKLCSSTAKSYDIKKVLTEFSNTENPPKDDIISICSHIKKVLNHHEMIGHFTRIHSSLRDVYDSVDFVDFPAKSKLPGCHLHFVRKQTREIFKAIEDNNFMELENSLQGHENSLNKFHIGGRNALFMAVMNDRIDPNIVKYLVKSGADVNQVDSIDGNNAFHVAAASNNIQALEILISTFPESMNACNLNQDTPLLIAIKNDYKNIDLELTQILVDNKCSLEICDNTGRTALIVAVEQNNLESTKMLIAAGANINAQMNNGKAPLWIASLKGYFDIVKELVACQRQSCDLNIQDHNLYTPLYCATQNGHYNIVEFLVANGAEILTRCSIGQTTLHACVRRDFENDKALKLFLSHGIFVDDPNDKGMTPLSNATNNDAHAATKLFLEHGANINHQSKETGRFPLYHAAYRGYLDMVKLLVVSGSDLNLQCNHGHTALHVACQEGHLEVIEFLLKSGAKRDILNSSRLSPLEMCRKTELHEKIDLLFQSI